VHLRPRRLARVGVLLWVLHLSANLPALAWETRSQDAGQGVVGIAVPGWEVCQTFAQPSLKPTLERRGVALCSCGQEAGVLHACAQQQGYHDQLSGRNRALLVLCVAKPFCCSKHDPGPRHIVKIQPQSI